MKVTSSSSPNKGQNKAHFRVIGDVHGLFRRYLDLANRSTHSLQVGDMGFDYDPLYQLDPAFHKFIGGNHDNYTRGECPGCTGDDCSRCQGRGFSFINMPPHCLPDFGIWSVPGVGDIFYARGAWSIDWKDRTPGHSWWDDEEMKAIRIGQAHQLYMDIKPKIVVTHTCPDSIVERIPFKRIFGPQMHHPRTEQFLEHMFSAHQPEIWLFGHYHCNWDQVIRGTRFVCIDELFCFDFDVDDTLQQTISG
jgi:hypothetical protein